MDLGIAGRKALVCAASKGLGKACALSLASEGAIVTINGRTRETLEETAAEIRAATGAQVTPIVADVSTEDGRAASLDACPEPDIIINNAGGPPPGDFRDWDRDAWLAALDANMLAPIFIIKATVDGMMERGFGRVINITSGAVKAPIDILGLSNGARSGLTGFIAGVARKTVHRNVTINNVLPSTFDTERLRSNLASQAKLKGQSYEDYRAGRLTGHPAKRVGDPEEFAAVCAFLCGAQAGYITGQNILLDGGAFPGTF